MHDHIRSSLVAVLLLALPVTTIAQDASPEVLSETPSYLFVLNGTSGSASDGGLRLEGVPSVVFFSDRPERIAGHMSLADFEAAWDAHADSLAADPPNAAISILGDEEDVVVEITGLDVEGDTVDLAIVVLDGALPDGGIGAAAVFVDDAHGTLGQEICGGRCMFQRGG